MKMRLTYLFLIIGLFSFSLNLFASYKTLEEVSIGNVIAKVVDDKCYLKDGVILVTSTGIFLCLEGDMISLPIIEADEEGVFLKAYRWPICPICHWPLTPWGTCANSSCPTNGGR